VGVPVDEDKRLGVGGEHPFGSFEASGIRRADSRDRVEDIEPHERFPGVAVEDQERYRHEQEDDDPDGVDGEVHSQDGTSEAQRGEESVVQEDARSYDAGGLEREPYQVHDADTEQDQEGQLLLQGDEPVAPLRRRADDPTGDLLKRGNRLYVPEPVVPPPPGEPARGPDQRMGHEVANGVRVRVAEVGHVVARAALHAVLDPDLLPGQLPGDGHLLFESDAVLRQAVDEARVAGELVVVVAGDERDLYVLTGSPE
jgi:hypothetical protein